MMQHKREEDREERIRMEIVVDANGQEERAMSWCHYLTDTLAFPFITRCRAKRDISPLHIGDEVDVIGMAPEVDCQHKIFVLMRWERDGLAVPLAQLAVTYADDETRQAVEDWLYWVDRGYRF
jgi:hypothetical protein